jgi:hypothetical protein
MEFSSFLDFRIYNNYKNSVSVCEKLALVFAAAATTDWSQA